MMVKGKWGEGGDLYAPKPFFVGASRLLWLIFISCNTNSFPFICSSSLGQTNASSLDLGTGWTNFGNSLWKWEWQREAHEGRPGTCFSTNANTSRSYGKKKISLCMIKGRKESRVENNLRKQKKILFLAKRRKRNSFEAKADGLSKREIGKTGKWPGLPRIT